MLMVMRIDIMRHVKMLPRGDRGAEFTIFNLIDKRSHDADNHVLIPAEMWFCCLQST